MKCKYCDSELMEGKRFCPNCGRDQDAENTVEIEAKKPAAGKIALAVAAVVVVLALLVAVIVGGMNSDLLSANAPTEATAGTPEATEPVETVAPTVPADGNPDDVTCKGTYTVTDEEALAAADTVVATMGDAQLTNGQLQVFYWEEVYAFLQEYGSYAPYFGLDYTMGLDVQTCAMAETSMTWQQYFLSCALDTWRSYQSMALEWAANGIAMDEDTQQYLNSLDTELESSAKEGGYESAKAMIESFVGVGPTVEDYIRFIELYQEGYTYFSHVYDNTNPTAEEVEAYFAENEASYAEQGITRDGVYVDIRHILIMPEGGETGSDGYPVYTDEAWAAAEEEANRIFSEWKNGGETTEDRFGQMAQEYSEDGSASNGGLYTDVYEGQMVENFNNWCFDENRKVGDYDLVKTQFGYHIMYFVGSRAIWYANAEYDLISQTVSALVPAAMEKYPAEVDYSAIKLGLVSLN